MRHSLRGNWKFACLHLWIPVFAGMTHSVAVADWPYWRGIEQAGRTAEKAVVKSWSPDGENLLWQVPIGGRTTPIVMGDHVYFIGPVGEGECLQERVICLDADSGQTRWEHRFMVYHSDVVENRLGWTSLVGDPETGNVYAHGTGGEMIAFNRDGRVLWNVSMTEVLGRISGYGGRLHTPIIDEDRVIISYLNSSWGAFGPGKHRYVAFNKHNGEILWWADPGDNPHDTTYSTPVVGVIDGVRQLVAGAADGNVYGMKARTGEMLWKFRFTKRGLNSSVVVDGKHVFIAHSEENLDNTDMGRVVCIDATQRGDITETGEVWRHRELTVGYASPTIREGRLYVVDNSANLYCLDAQTGKTIWEFGLGRVGKGSPVVTADGVIYVAEQNGVFHILKDEGDRCVSLDRDEFTRSDNLIDEIFGSPAVTGGRVYFATRYHTYCLGSRDTEVESVSAVPMAKERTADADQPSYLQIRPADFHLLPGQSVQLRAMVTDELATSFRPLKEGTWTVKGVKGKIGGDGKLQADTENEFSAGMVTVKGEGLEATARVRIIPQLPISEGFEGMTDGASPPGWIGAGAKTRIEERDGSKVLRKLASKDRPSPPFMRLQTYATPPIDGGYTVQTDVLGTVKQAFRPIKPDMGVINSRYVMSLLGSGKLRIESWTAIPRIRHDFDFPWEGETWYRMKCQVELRGDEAVLRGKVWLRESAEPDEWNFEVTDSCPNRSGSAGLYAYSAGTTHKSDGPEVFFDNFEVTRNDE